MTKKIVNALCKIKNGSREPLILGNLYAKRDWGHAKDYVYAMWKILQQKKPDDFVIATGVQYSVRDFIQWTASELGLELEFEGDGVNEVARVASIVGTNAPALSVGDIVMRINPRYFRPSEVDTLLGDPGKAKEKLGWVPEITAQEMCAEMVEEDLKAARRAALLREHGLELPVSVET